MVTKKVKALKDVGIATGLDKKKLKIGEIQEITFRDVKQYQNFLGLGCFEEYNIVTPELPRPKVVKPKVKLPSTPPSNPIKKEVKEEKIEISNQAKKEPLNVQVKEGISKCRECNTILIPATDESDPKNIRHILYCPKCGKEVQAVAEVNVPQQPKREISVCPKCGKRKSKDAEFCKACLEAGNK
jgi:ribosomal protein L40E